MNKRQNEKISDLLELTFEWNETCNKQTNYKVHYILESEVLCRKWGYNWKWGYKIETASY